MFRFNRTTFVWFSTISAALTLSTASIAHANDYDDARGWFGVNGGLSVPTEGNTSARGMYGFEGGAKLGDTLGIGVYYESSQKTEDKLGKFNYDLYGVQLGYYFDGDAQGAYFGGRLGATKLTLDNATPSPFHFGVFAGYNYMFNRHFSLGGEFQFYSVSQTDEAAGFNMLNFLGSAKFWF